MSMPKMISLAFVISLIFSSMANAVTSEYFCQDGVAEAGIFLFACGLILIFIPRLTKLGIIYTLIGNAIVIIRILFLKDIEAFVASLKINQYIESLSEDDLRLYTGIVMIMAMVIIGLVLKLLKLLWRLFWRLFGFYKNEEELKVSKEKQQRKIEKKFLKGFSIAVSEKSSLKNLDRKEIELDLNKISSVIESDDKRG